MFSVKNKKLLATGCNNFKPACNLHLNIYTYIYIFMFVNLHLNWMPPRISPHLGSKFMLLEPINAADMIPSQTWLGTDFYQHFERPHRPNWLVVSARLNAPATEIRIEVLNRPTSQALACM